MTGTDRISEISFTEDSLIIVEQNHRAVRLRQGQHCPQERVVDVWNLCRELVEQLGRSTPGVPGRAQVIFTDIDGDAR